MVNGAGISDLNLTGDAFPGTPVVPECYNFRICYVVKFSIASNTCIKKKKKYKLITGVPSIMWCLVIVIHRNWSDNHCNWLELRYMVINTTTRALLPNTCSPPNLKQARILSLLSFFKI